jgi:predicted ester cyclase
MDRKETAAERNTRIAKEFFDKVFNKGDLAFIDRTIAPTYSFDGQHQNPADLKGWVTGLRTTFPDLHFSIEQILAEGDTVALRWKMTGTHKGGPNPDGAAIESTGTNIITFDKEGRGTSNWQNGLCTKTVQGKTQTFTDSLIYQS